MSSHVPISIVACGILKNKVFKTFKQLFTFIQVYFMSEIFNV